MAQPSDSVFDRDADTAHEAAQDAAAEADLRQGRIVEDRPVRDWLAALARGEKRRPPQP